METSQKSPSLKEYLDCAMEIGEQMLINGAEVHRVEDSMCRICRAFGAIRTDVFIITSSMVVTIHSPDSEIYTQTRRITSIGTDFNKLDKLNQLSRKICSEKLDVNSVKEELSKIASTKNYPLWLECLAYSLSASAFTLFFGGNLNQIFISFLIGLALRFVVMISEKTVKNLVFTKFISSAVIALLAFFAIKLQLAPRTDEIIIGNIMLLISGTGFTTALRDIFTGDSIAGILRCLEAVLCAIAIALGYFVIAFVTGGVAI